MDPSRSRLALGIVAVALIAGLCFAAVWSALGRLPAPVAVAPAADPALRAENIRLRAEVARLTAERNPTLARAPVATASPVPPMPAQALPSASRERATEPAPLHRAAMPAPAAHPDGFAEPQTFTSVSTAY